MPGRSFWLFPIIVIPAVAFLLFVASADAALQRSEKLQRSESVVRWYENAGAWTLRPRFEKCWHLLWRSAEDRCYRHRQGYRFHVERIDRLTPDPPPLAWRETVAAWLPTLACEGGRHGWHANTGNGFYGGLQFDYGTWLAHGGGAFAARADLASPQAQALVASRLSYDGWPNCPNP